MFVVIENHGGANYAAICINENGENMVFSTESEAAEYAKDCQEGVVIEL